ncbi:MAG: putative metal-binding motif-containing protein [Elusimicrobia bacterium]|nr:putative metal-binding motif-containing protein [Elusimicrobiota bacterium]
MSISASWAVAALLAPAIALAESVNWTVAVSAQEKVVTREFISVDKTAALSGSGGIQGYNPPAGTERIDVAFLVLQAAGGCPNYGSSVYDITHHGGYYSIWYTYLGSYIHKIQVFAGSVGGTLLYESRFEMVCPNGYRQMTVTFDNLVATTKVEPRSATAAGTLTGGFGETASAEWTALPQTTLGGTLESFQAAVSGDNTGAALSLSVNPDNVSGTVSAKFPDAPKCVPSLEVCDGVDNDCDGLIDEDQGGMTCGQGACANTAPSCVDGKANACVPLAPSAEVCDGVDNDCDGAVDEDLGTLSCGAGACANSVAACAGGKPQACAPLPASPETCDGVDNDCDGVVDNGCSKGILKLIERFFGDPTPPPGAAKKIGSKPKK